MQKRKFPYNIFPPQFLQIDLSIYWYILILQNNTTFSYRSMFHSTKEELLKIKRI